MFVPQLALAALKTLRAKYGKKIYGKYGFVDAFNPNTGWVDRDVIGIDLGITLLGAEDARTGAVWRWFMKNPEISKAMGLAGLNRYRPVGVSTGSDSDRATPRQFDRHLIQTRSLPLPVLTSSVTLTRCGRKVVRTLSAVARFHP
jgi:hypothetical protein